MGTVNTLGQMDVSTRDLGRMENNTVKVFTDTQMEQVERVFGKMEKGQNG